MEGAERIVSCVSKGSGMTEFEIVTSVREGSPLSSLSLSKRTQDNHALQMPRPAAEFTPSTFRQAPGPLKEGTGSRCVAKGDNVDLNIPLTALSESGYSFARFHVFPKDVRPDARNRERKPAK